MTGTAILFHEDSSVTFLENIDIADYQLWQISKANKFIPFRGARLSYFCEDEIDWDYGY